MEGENEKTLLVIRYLWKFVKKEGFERFAIVDDMKRAAWPTNNR